MGAGPPPEEAAKALVEPADELSEERRAAQDIGVGAGEGSASIAAYARLGALHALTSDPRGDFPFTIAIEDDLDKTELTLVRSTVEVRGWHVPTGYRRVNGLSWVDLPAYEESEV